MNSVMTEEEKMIIDDLDNELVKIISENENLTKYDLRLEKSFNYLSWIGTVSLDTEFRYVFLVDTVVISRVKFRNNHNGCMTRCLKSIENVAEKTNMHRIIVQSVSTIEMANWCSKMGFVPADYYSASKVDGIPIYCDYVLKL